ncbi:ABC transporter permease [Acuticoccus sp.]|uniref:ABC transporter permease n=1 Tax=Acuticoccus sp. TaxID=1904378 RepID=UPI003B52A93B
MDERQKSPVGGTVHAGEPAVASDAPTAVAPRQAAASPVARETGAPASGDPAHDLRVPSAEREATVLPTGAGYGVTTINARRWQIFRRHKLGYVSLWLFIPLFVLSLFAEFLANDRPLVAMYKGELLFPVLVDYPEEKFGGFYARTDYRDPFIHDEIAANGWMVWPPIRYDYRVENKAPPTPLPSAPSWMFDREERCAKLPAGVDDPGCTVWNYNWLGTDDLGRDVLARAIYGFRLSVLFGLCLTVLSSVIGVAAGAVQGYVGGWTDLLFQRVIEIWTAIPSLYLILIFSAVFTPSFFLLLGILLLFSWVALVGVVRAEFLRARNFEYVTAARALGVGPVTIMGRHLLPNAMVATLTFLPFIMSGSITTLTSLDFLGLGLPPGSASLGELLAQGKNNPNAPWLGLTGFAVISLMLSLLIFVGEGVRDAFDPRKTFA